jgi:DNA modification methylase
VVLGVGDARRIPLREGSVQCVVTSPPYWGLRDYGLNGRGIGLEASPDEYVAQMVAVFREVWRVLRKDGTVWGRTGRCG